MSKNESHQGANQPDYQQSELGDAQRRRQQFERAYWDWAEYLTRKAAEKAAQKQAEGVIETD